MATNGEKTILQGVLEFAAGTAATLGVEAAVKAVRVHLGTLAQEKAKELFIDSGDRAKMFVEVAKLVTIGMTEDEKAAAGEKTRLWIVGAWKEHDEEGELTGLLKKVPDEGRPPVLWMLGNLSSYQEFAETIRAFLAHDNLFQKARKFARQAESAGETIVSDDVRKVWTATTNTIDTLAAAARPGVRTLTDTLRRIR
jgi:hypothetical protein